MDVSNTDFKKPLSKKEKKKKPNKIKKKKIKQAAKSFNTYNKKLNLNLKKSKNEFEGSFDYSPMMNIYKN
jgi:hypothetical protein